MLKKQAQQQSSHNNLERWLLTYSDLITLLMIFFVVMYAISDTNAQKLAALAQSLKAALVGSPEGFFESPGPSLVTGLSGSSIPLNSEEVNGGEAAALKEVEQELTQFLTASGLKNQVTLKPEERGLVISIAEMVLFPKGSADLTPQAREILGRLGRALAPLPNLLRVEGHTDNLPVKSEVFRSNWELSVLRATNVVHFLIEESKIDPRRLSATGYSQYRPIAPNDSEANMARNRRVDIVILKEAYKALEPSDALAR